VSAFAEGIDAFIVSISVIIGIIVGVIVIVVLTAVIVVCCCCKHRDFSVRRQKSYTSTFRTGLTEVPVIEPSGRILTRVPFLLMYLSKI